MSSEEEIWVYLANAELLEDQKREILELHFKKLLKLGWLYLTSVDLSLTNFKEDFFFFFQRNMKLILNNYKLRKLQQVDWCNLEVGRKKQLRGDKNLFRAEGVPRELIKAALSYASFQRCTEHIAVLPGAFNFCIKVPSINPSDSKVMYKSHGKWSRERQSKEKKRRPKRDFRDGNNTIIAGCLFWGK